MADTATRRVRWGILGDAKINRRLVPALKAAGNAELVAIASRSADKAAAAASKWGVPKSFPAYQALLDSPDVDAVYIPLPNHLHAEWTIKAADAGKHVLCEKPLALSAAEAQQMLDHCRRNQVRLMDGFMWPHHPRTQAIRHAIDQGRIGEIKRMTAGFSFNLGDPSNVRYRPEFGGGSLMDVGCYPVYFARWLFRSEPKRVYAVAEMQTGVDLRLDGLIEFPGGAVALFDCAFNLPYRLGVEVVGTTGRLWIPHMWLPPERARFEIIQDDECREIITLPEAHQVVAMVEHFSAAVLEGRDPLPGPEEGVKTMRVLDALAQSVRQRQAVDL